MKSKEDIKTNQVNEPVQAAYGFAHISEEEKLLLEMRKPGIEKLQSFTRMIRRNNSTGKAANK